jgi:hypothetical protein
MLCKERPVVCVICPISPKSIKVSENSRARLQYRSENKLDTLDFSGFVASVL